MSAEESAAAGPQGPRGDAPELKWLYERLVGRLPLLRRLPTRQSVLLQLLVMELLALGNCYWLRLGAPRRSVAAAWLALAAKENDPVGRELRETAWALFAGSLPYRSIMWRLLSPRVLVPFIGRTIAEAASRKRSGPVTDFAAQ